MSSCIKRLETAVEKIEEIEKICKLKGVAKALEDESILKPAIMKHFDVIHQQFEKLEKAQEYHILSKIDKDDLKGLKQVRNWSSHDYDNIENIQKVLKETKKDMCEDLQKKIDRFVKKQDILTSQAKSKLKSDIQKSYDILQKNGLELDKTYTCKLGSIIKDNSNVR